MFDLSTEELIADMSTTEAFTYFLDCYQSQLDELNEIVYPIQKEIDESNSVLAEEIAKNASKSTTNAWKRKGALDLSKPKEPDTIVDTKAHIEELQKKMSAYEGKLRHLKQRINQCTTFLEENEEMAVWSEALENKVDLSTIPKPAIIKRLEEREAEDLAESLKKPGWVRLPLQHNSSQGQALRDAFYAKCQTMTAEYDAFHGRTYVRTNEKMRTVEKDPEVVDDDQSDTEADPLDSSEQIPQRRVAWWYKKYNVSLAC
jgi:hypothetical protein